jgi:mRNA-degrading endonuclease RelE of RelBE toxin-antitoxin system
MRLDAFVIHRISATVIYTNRAKKELPGLPPDITRVCILCIADSRSNPFLFVHKREGAKRSPLYSLRIVQYHAVMAVQDKKATIYILEIRHRSVMYRK